MNKDKSRGYNKHKPPQNKPKSLWWSFTSRKYIDYAYKNDFMGFGVETEIEYNKMELLRKFGVENNSGILNSKQCQGGLLLIKKCKRTMNLIKKWYEITSGDNYENIIDDKDDSIQHKVIKDHRHDQAVLSLLVKTLGFKFIEDETWKSPFWHIDGKDIPVWAIRNKEEDLTLFNVYSIDLPKLSPVATYELYAYNCFDGNIVFIFVKWLFSSSTVTGSLSS